MCRQLENGEDGASEASPRPALTCGAGARARPMRKRRGVAVGLPAALYSGVVSPSFYETKGGNKWYSSLAE